MSDSRPHSSPADKAAPGPSRAERTRKRAAHHTLLFGLTKHRNKLWWVAAAAAVAIVGAGLVFRYTALTWAGVIEWIDALNPLAVLPLMALLPIVGFPISVVYLVAGARFGPIWGGVVVTGVTVVHLLGTYLVARSFVREPLRRFIARRHAHLPEIPEDEQAAICVIAALVPGLPYVVRNYLLALSGVRLRYYLWVCLPIYVARSYVTILMGNLGNDPTRTKIIVLIMIDMLKVAICALVIWRLRVHHRKYHGHPEDNHDQAPNAVAPPNAEGK